MSVKKARIYLKKLKWRSFLGHKQSIRRGAYKFKAHMGTRYGRPTLWVTSNGQIMHMVFFSSEKTPVPWKDYDLTGRWLSGGQFKALTGLEPDASVVSDSD
jgi:hypothetical protein